MKRMMIVLAIVMAIVSVRCSSQGAKERQEDYCIGNAKETAAAARYISAMQHDGRFHDSITVDSYTAVFPAVFGKTDYNAVRYHRKYVDTIILDTLSSETKYDFFYLIDQNTCVDKIGYLGR